MIRNMRGLTFIVTMAITTLATVARATERPQVSGEGQGIRIADASDGKVTIDIPQQPLTDSLRALGAQANINIVYDPPIVENRTAPAIQGQISIKQALATLLKDTGLSYEYVSDKTVAIHAFKPVQTTSLAREGRDEVPAGNEGEEDGGVRLAQTENQSKIDQQARDSSAGVSPQGEKEEGVQLEEIVVTGTHIRGVTGTTSPLMVFDRAAIERSGYSTVDQFIESLPQSLGTVGQDTGNTGSLDAATNYGDGTSINLRGLGGKATLVLVNGRRLAPAGFFGSFNDASLVPLSAIERIEILTDGASAIYGSDAVGGVVNFILRTNYEGAETSVEVGSVTDGHLIEYRASQALGTHWEGGTALLSYDFYSRDALEARDREFSSESFPDMTLLPEQKRHNVYANVEQELSERLKLSADALYSKRDSTRGPILSGFSKSDSQTEQAQVSVGARYRMGEAWNAQLIAGYSDYELAASLFGSNLSADADATSLEGQIDGTILELPGGSLRLAFGSSYRQENFSSIGSTASNSTTAPEREVIAFFGELFFPLIGSSNHRVGIEALELSLAARYEDYSDYGNDVTPKVGLRWEPVKGLNIRSTYGESFKAPDLNQVYSPEVATVINTTGFVPGDPLVLFRDNGNPDLTAETADNWTIGFDWRPLWSPLSISATYYTIDFDGRINVPAFNSFDFFTFPERFDSLLIADPDDALVDTLLANAADIVNFAGPDFTPAPFTSADINFVADNRVHNIAIEKQSGYDVTINYPLDTARGRFDFVLNSTYMETFDRRVTSASPTADVRNILNGPIDLRARGGVSWSRKPLGASLFLNYQDDYKNADANSTPIGSWTTADLTLHCELGDPAGESLTDGLDIRFSVINLFDKDPPHVVTGFFDNVNYDPSNGDPLGRFVSLFLRKRW